MARKKSKQQGLSQKELVPGQQTAPKNPVSPGDAAGGGGGDAGLDRLPTTRANQVGLASCKSISIYNRGCSSLVSDFAQICNSPASPWLPVFNYSQFKSLQMLT